MERRLPRFAFEDMLSRHEWHPWVVQRPVVRCDWCDLAFDNYPLSNINRGLLAISHGSREQRKAVSPIPSLLSARAPYKKTKDVEQKLECDSFASTMVAFVCHSANGSLSLLSQDR